MKTGKEKTEIPENIPVITSEMMEKTAMEIAKKRTGKKQSPVEGVKDIKCPSCGNSAMSYADDLTFDVRSTKIIENYTDIKEKNGHRIAEFYGMNCSLFSIARYQH